MLTKYECYFDASHTRKSCKGAFYIANGEKLVKMTMRKIDAATSDMAEAEMLHCLLQYISQKIPVGSRVCVYGDAQSVINCATGQSRKSKRFRKLNIKYVAMSKQYRLSIEYLPRSQNNLADQLSKGNTKEFHKLYDTEDITDILLHSQDGLINKIGIFGPLNPKLNSGNFSEFLV